MKKGRIILVLLIVAGILLTGCTAPPQEEHTEVACTNDADCPSGQTCHHEVCEAEVESHEE